MIERRYTAQHGVQLKTRADGKPMIAGYAAVFFNASDPGTSFRLWSDAEERILPGAFDRAIKEDDVRGLFNHDASQLLGRTTAKTLRLSVDEKGLMYEIDAPDTQAGRDVIELLSRGDVTASSFGFVPLDTTYREEVRDGKTIYIIERNAVQLWDVSPVTFPAYASTSAGVRSEAGSEAARKELDAWKAGRKRAARDPILARARAVEIAG